MIVLSRTKINMNKRIYQHYIRIYQ